MTHHSNLEVDEMAPKATVLAPSGMLGYGIPEASFAEGLKRDPDVIAIDAGSTDPGPYYLGAGVSYTNRSVVKKDLALMLEAGYERGIPVLVGTAGGGGGRPHLEWLTAIAREICGERGYHFRVALIDGEMDKEWLKGQVRDGRARTFETEWDLTEDEVDRSSRVVAQMGPEPFMRALDEGATLILAGRASDPGVMAAYPLRLGLDPGVTIHMGKILECGAAAAYPRHGSDCLLGFLYEDHFLVEPPNPAKVCTVASVAAHTLYERADPYRSYWPGGLVDLTGSRFEQHDERTVKVSGTKFHPSDEYWVKLEGAARVGYRTITIAGTRDPILLANFDQYQANVRERIRSTLPQLEEGRDYRLIYHVYGKDGVMGALEPQKEITSHELGLVIDVVAETEDLSRTVLAIARSLSLHSTYPGRKAIAGNLAFPFSPSDIGVGDVYEFNVYHLLRVDDPVSPFPTTYEDW
jgi:hypothetical protein